ncbi:MAG: sugar phosphate isomerase/epimerase [Clostridiaceae bacterium]|nr:sugar phosphate isomerase/epimerase [Clostridiaceae bacterium]
MKIGTGIYLEKLNQNPDFYQEAYTCLELQDFVMPNNLDENRDSLIDQYTTVLKNYKGLLTIHGPYIDLHPTSFDPLVRDVCVQRYRQALGAAKALNAKFMVVHSNYENITHYAGYETYFLQESISFWKNLIKEFEASKVTAVIENIHNKNAHLIRSIIDAVDSPYLAACLDTGHAHALGKSQLITWVESYGQHLQYIHLHDNNGEQDQHLPLGEGTIDFQVFFAKLKEIQYDSVMICEIFGEIESQQKNLKQLEILMKQQ